VSSRRSDAGGSELAVKTAAADAASTGPRADGVLLDEQRLDADMKRSFDESDGDYGSPRVRADLREWGWKVTKKTVEASMARAWARRSADETPVPFRDPPGQGRRARTGPGPTGLHRSGDQRHVVWRPDRDPTDEGKL
jgi:HTH-like domain